MNTKFSRRALAFLTAMTIFSSMTAAQAAETVGTAVTAEDLSLKGCAENIKRIYKERYPEQAEMIEEIVDTVSANRNVICAFEQDGAVACRIIEDSLCDVLMPSAATIAYDDDYYYTSHLMPSIKQTGKYYCGPASTLMALIGSGSETYYYTRDTNITNQWQADLASELGTNSEGTYMWKVTSVMNKYIESRCNRTYRSKDFTRFTKLKTVLEYITESLINDAVPILEVFDTTHFKYYNGTHYEHYIIIEAIDFANEELRVRDPNNLNDDYFGVKYITFEELENTILYSRDLEGYMADVFLSTYTVDKLPDDKYIY